MGGNLNPRQFFEVLSMDQREDDGQQIYEWSQQGQRVGRVETDPYDPGGARLVRNIEVDPQFRGRGLSKEMLRTVRRDSPNDPLMADKFTPEGQRTVARYIPTFDSLYEGVDDEEHDVVYDQEVERQRRFFEE